MKNKVIIRLDGIKECLLWETSLIRISCTRELFVNIPSEHGQDYI